MSRSIDGFRFAGVEAGIKPRGGLDLGLILADEPVTTAAVFTQNLVRAHPLEVAFERTRARVSRAVLVNSGNANACAGEAGARAVLATTQTLAEAVGCPASQVLPASTGVIGVPLPSEIVNRAVPQLVAALEADCDRFSQSILTTDRFTKVASTTLATDDGDAQLLVIAKGAGMIHPDLATGLPQATMLAFICTDAAVAPTELEATLVDASRVTFNACTVDGDTSTNDTVIAMASGRRGRATRDAVTVAMRTVCEEVARKMVLDGEGAEHAVDLTVRGLASDADARRIAHVVATSLLVKTAFSGCDPNWGRLLAAAGRSGVRFNPLKSRILVDDVLIAENSSPMGEEAEARATTIMRGEHFGVTLELGDGPGEFTYITSDLGHGYVDVNASYRS